MLDIDETIYALAIDIRGLTAVGGYKRLFEYRCEILIALADTRR